MALFRILKRFLGLCGGLCGIISKNYLERISLFGMILDEKPAPGI